MTTRRVLVVWNTGRAEARDIARSAINVLVDAGINVRVLASEADSLTNLPTDSVEIVEEGDAAADCELVVVLGGDGTILRAAELAHGHDAPVLGANLGHMGFLAESEPEQLPKLLAAVVAGEYTIEQRMAVQHKLFLPDGSVESGWALNEVSVEKSTRARMLDLVIAVDNEPLSRWRADGLVCATPTGSTAYAWSAGGPVVWPDVEALVVAPISAHALFSRPLVVSPRSEIEVEIMPESDDAVINCDGRRQVNAPAGSRIEVSRCEQPVLLARVHSSSFAHRLVAKFDLPVSGWRGRATDESGRS